MFDLSAYLWGLATLASVAVVAWLVSLAKKDVSIVDVLWGLFFLIAASVYGATVEESGARGALLIVLVAIWSLRLSGYILWRNWGEGEDRRYRDMRRRNDHFAIKSLYLVFLLQAVLAWIISLPLLAALNSSAPLGWLDGLGVLLWLVGMVFEAGGDYQLARFKADPANRGKVLNSGLWRYTRHPNYFGDFCVWWGFYLIALSAGGWWAIVSPLLMSFFLIKVSGVALTEKNMSEDKPEYAEYKRRTNAFFPGPPKKPQEG